MKSVTVYLVIAIFGYLALSANVPLKSEAHSKEENKSRERANPMLNMKSRVVEQPRSLPRELEVGMTELKRNVERLKQKMSLKGK